ncbi:MAG: TolC family protein [Saprospirales bacterium]|nr:TolC family protein [Saprospirales bacterium]
MDLQFAEMERQNATLEIGTYLWSADGFPMRPVDFPAAQDLSAGLFNPAGPGAADSLIQTAKARHPALLQYALKLKELDVERRLKLEEKKPILDFHYQLLGNGWQFFPTAGIDGVGILGNDIKWGIQFSYPLLNRKARGDLQSTRIKIAQTDFSWQQKRLEIENKVRQYLNELDALAGQIATFRDISANYRILLEAENEKFRFGESSVFLINTREQRWLEAQIKYFKLLCAYRKTEAGLWWATGTLAE